MKTRTKILAGTLGVLILGGGAFGAAAVAHAQGFGGPGGMMRGGMGMAMDLFDEVDANGDGKVERAEMDAFVKKDLRDNDGNGDGSLTLAEFQSLWLERTKPLMVRGFQFLDADGDGNVTGAEMEKPAGRAFDRLDRNGDGAVAEDEIGRGDWHGRHGPGREGRDDD
ncbi:MAG: hypothetical protein KDG89_12200 [Geminicoccaceae bacterium]|nr:hypothetical protein [Geminicoccaceae bacterium]